MSFITQTYQLDICETFNYYNSIEKMGLFHNRFVLFHQQYQIAEQY